MPLTDGSSLFIPLKRARYTLCSLASSPFAKTVAPLVAEVRRRTHCDELRGKPGVSVRLSEPPPRWQRGVLYHRPSLQRTTVSKKAKTCTLPPCAGLTRNKAYDPAGTRFHGCVFLRRHWQPTPFKAYASGLLDAPFHNIASLSIVRASCPSSSSTFMRDIALASYSFRTKLSENMAARTPNRSLRRMQYCTRPCQ